MNHSSGRAARAYINGEWRNADDGDIAVWDPSTGQQVGHIATAPQHEVTEAVAAARVAQRAWRRTPLDRRIEILSAAITILKGRAEALGEIITTEVGTPRQHVGAAQVGAAIQALEDVTRFAPGECADDDIDGTTVVKEPVGVVAAITPWNYPLFQAALKVAPAIVSGSTVVLKPSEVTPFCIMELTDALAAAGLPPGVLNVVFGGAAVGEQLCTEPDVDMISLTGSVRAGIGVARAAALDLKKVTLELGGKSPLVVLDDADIDAAVRYGVRRCLMNAGQTCAAFTRVLVPQPQASQASRIAADEMSRYVVGSAHDSTVTLGPVISKAQRDRISSLISLGQQQGARLVRGGVPDPDDDRPGWFVEPTLFDQVDADMTIAAEEIFGPVLCLMPYSDTDDAVRIANSTRYGLAAGVYTSDRHRARTLARELRAGVVFIDDIPPNSAAPFGGVGHSGYGRERGPYGIREYLEPKSIIERPGTDWQSTP